MDDFYVTLISNGNPASFTVRLPEKVRLDGKWSVALTEFSYIDSRPLLDVDEDYEATILIDYADVIYPIVLRNLYFTTAKEYLQSIEYAVEKNMGADTDLDLLLQKYPDAEEFVNPIKKRSVEVPPLYDETALGDEPLEKVFELKLHEKEHKISFVPKKKGLKRIWLPPKLRELLGFSKPIEFPNMNQRKGDKEYCLDHNYETIYVYTDIIEPQIVCNYAAKLLRVIPYEGLGRQNFAFIANYLPVEPVSISTISIKIKNVSGKTLNLAHGPTIAVLHFKHK